MNNHLIKTLLLPLILLFSGCASYTVTEKDMTDYLHKHVSFEQSVGIENVMHAFVSIQNMEVNIGRADVNRVSILANTSAKVQVWNQPERKLELDLEFSAIPNYDKQSGEIFLNSLRLERFEEESQLLTPEIKKLLKPAVSMIGSALSQYPVYRLDSNKVKEALIKSAEPNLVIKDHKLVIELFD